MITASNCRITDKELKKQLLKAQKMLLEFERNSKKCQWNVTKLRYKLNEISPYAYFVGAIGMLFLPIKINMLYVSALLKTTAGVGVGTAGAITGSSILAAGLITASMSEYHSNIYNSEISTDTKQELVMKRLENIKESVLVSKPSFNPIKGTIILINGDEIKGVIIDYNNDYVTIKSETETKTFNIKSEVFKVLW